MTTWIMAVLTRAIRRYLQVDPETLTRLGALSGKAVKMELTGWDIAFYLLPDATGIHLLNQYNAEVDATIKGSPLALLRIGFASAEEKVQLARSLEITGDVELAHTLSHIIQQSQMDWEEPLSQLTGDVIAHQIGNVARSARRWGENIAQNLRQNMTEYLQEEIRLLPPRQEIEDFFAMVHCLRNDCERLATRVETLTHVSSSQLD